MDDCHQMVSENIHLSLNKENSHTNGFCKQLFVFSVSQFLPGHWVFPTFKAQIWKYDEDYNMAEIQGTHARTRSENTAVWSHADICRSENTQTNCINCQKHSSHFPSTSCLTDVASYSCLCVRSNGHQMTQVCVETHN